jgi:ABC-type branched-subunit amino acid transport system substrate-binding protein
MIIRRFETSAGALSKRRRGTRATVSAVLAVALVATACSSSKKAASVATSKPGTTAAATGSTTASTAAASGGDLIIGGSTYSADFTDTDTGFLARITRFNASGGINGRKIKFVGAKDDGGSSATNQTQVQSLILNDHVMALAPVVTTAFQPASSDFAIQNHVPFFSWSFLPNECNSPWSYGFNGCLVGSKVLNSSLTDPVSTLLGDPKSIRLAIQQNDNPSGLTSQALFSKLIALRGGQTVYQQANMPTTGTVDYTPYVQAILKTKPNLIILGPLFAQNIALSAALKAAGYKGAIQDYQTYVPGLLAKQPSVAAALEGEYIDSQIPPQEAETPAIKQMEADLTAIGKPTTLSLGDQVGYWIADLLIEMLQATAKAGRPLTGDGLQQTANSGTFTYTPPLEGGVGPVKFPDAESAPVPCAALVQVAGAQYKVVVPFKCYENLPSS